jgi:uncharacterized NAD(P)/FAD-binding protein YdhS
VESLAVDRVVNCTGPEGDTRVLGDPLVSGLRAAGHFTPDALGLGAEVTPHGALVDHEGRPSRVLHHVGPFLRAGYWEATAVPELRVFAARLAGSLVDALGVAGEGTPPAGAGGVLADGRAGAE